MSTGQHLPASAAELVFEKPFVIRADAARVWRALSAPDELTRWFAEHVAVELRPGGAYRFWGRHTPWVPREADADQRVTALTPGSALTFSWTWRTSPCTVALRLEARGGECTLHVRMTTRGQHLGFGDESVWYMHDFWRVAAGNLAEFIRSGRPGVRPDYSDPGRGVDLSVIVNAPVERVYAALTDPEQMNLWIAARAAADLRPGGVYGYGWTVPNADGSRGHCGPHTVVEVIPNRRLVHDWSFRDEPHTRVVWELTPVPGGTRVRLTHAKQNTDPAFGGYTQGWTSFLILLKDFAEGRPIEKDNVALDSASQPGV